METANHYSDDSKNETDKKKFAITAFVEVFFFSQLSSYFSNSFIIISHN